jgi:epimerase transport system membrane fusion protein
MVQKIKPGTLREKHTSPEDFQSDITGPRRSGLVLLTAVFGVFGLWAALAPLDGAAFAPGTVTVRSYKKIIQHLEGGIVSEILAQDGDLVEEGQPILILDDTQARAELEIASTQLIGLMARKSRLEAERDGLMDVVYTTDLPPGDRRAEEEMEAQNSIFHARKAANEGRGEILTQRIVQLQSQVEGMRALKASKDLLVSSFTEELEDTRVLLEQGFSEKTRVREIERNFAAVSGDSAELAANIAATEVQIGETRLQMIQLKSEFLNEVVSELSEIQTSLNDVYERVNALEDIVERTIIKAPEQGKLNGMQVHTVGGVIGAGTEIAELVPESDDLILEAAINPMDIDRVTEGQEARIRFSAFGSRAPTIFGVLLSLSADAFANPNDGSSYYLARIEVNPESLDELGDLSLMPGMPAEIFINTGSRTFLQYLMKPLSNTVSRSFNED